MRKNGCHTLTSRCAIPEHYDPSASYHLALLRRRLADWARDIAGGAELPVRRASVAPKTAPPDGTALIARTISSCWAALTRSPRVRAYRHEDLIRDHKTYQVEVADGRVSELLVHTGAAHTWQIERVTTEPLTDADLARIEARAAGALDVAPAPWIANLEARHGIGGCSFIRLGGDPDVDNELYVDLRLGAEQVTSPDERLDAVVDFLGSAADDVPRLVAEIRRLRTQLSGEG